MDNLPQAALTPTRRSRRLMDLERQGGAVANGLTPRTRRRQTLAHQADERKKINRARQEAAAAKRKASSLCHSHVPAKDQRAPSYATLPSSSSLSTTSSSPGSHVAKKHKPVPKQRKPRNDRDAAAEERGSHAEESKLQDVVKDLKAANEELRRRCQHQDAAHQKLQQVVDDKHAQVSQLQGDLVLSQADAQKANAAVKEHQAVAEQLQTKVNQLQAELSDVTAAVQTLNKQVEAREATILELNERCASEAQVRRDLHNTIQELRGNVRVFARVRPFLPHEKEESGDGRPSPLTPAENDPDQKSLMVNGPERTSVDGKAKMANEWKFTFDRSFHSWEPQEAVFNEVTHLVQSALDGYRVCLFAYGQTGAGKTYTMEGGDDAWEAHGKSAGVIPRSVHLVFDSAAHTQRDGWSFTFHASFLEIYNEQLRDLLADNGANAENTGNRVNNGDNGDEMKKLEVRMKADGSGDTEVVGLSSVQVADASDVRRLMKEASARRSVAATLCNARSSRSHAVFRLFIHAVNQARGEERTGIINLVDLAGSERLKQSQAQGAQLKETQAINKSLSALGTVFASLASKAKHVPYRNSKLTMVLRDSLGGNSKALMVVNVAPGAAALEETLSSLRFGLKVNACEVGTAKRNIKGAK